MGPVLVAAAGTAGKENVQEGELQFQSPGLPARPGHTGLCWVSCIPRRSLDMACAGDTQVSSQPPHLRSISWTVRPQLVYLGGSDSQRLDTACPASLPLCTVFCNLSFHPQFFSTPVLACALGIVFCRLLNGGSDIMWCPQPKGWGQGPCGCVCFELSRWLYVPVASIWQ